MEHLKTIAVSLMLAFPWLTQAQFLDFPTQNATWCYGGYADQGQDLGLFCFSPDTLLELNGKTYAKITYQPHPSASPEDILYRSDNGKFFVIPQDSTDEILIYDFNLEVSDTFYVNWGFWLQDSILLTVQSVEYITTLDGVSRKKMFLENQGYHITWLEGIGNTDWVFVAPAYVSSVSGGYQFVCHAVEDSIIYPDGTSPSLCGLSATNHLSQQDDRAVKIYPNPVKNEFNLEFTGIEARQIAISDVLGNTVFQSNCTQKSQMVEIPDNIKPGFYVLRLVQLDGKMFAKKFLKE
ncbi:MAG: T9SS type A sorting domain-containing protein [Lewinellaceae bacterium]|nr:T9SS type A sorting domain-containing protein [Lewinellaceae bacterium]